MRIAYCTNVHAGASLRETKENLQRYSTSVQQSFGPDEKLGVGLWLSAESANELADEKSTSDFANWLDAKKLAPFTFNGFPYGDFHQPVVKKKVYLPDWRDPLRLEYTKKLARILDAVAPDSCDGSISTLPVAWGNPPLTQNERSQAAKLLAECATFLAVLEQERGRLIHLCIEPEPGCEIQRSQDLVDFLEQDLFPHGNEGTIRRHIRVCHDVCHAVVMCESQRDVLQRYKAAGIAVGKVQISSAIVVDFDQLDLSDRRAAWRQLSGFAEDRYLHQTTIEQSGKFEFFNDLPEALASVTADQAKGTWRVHFHVPVYLPEFGLLKTSQPEIIECLAACSEFTDTEHFEVETYAWNVLPEELRQIDLATGIAREMKWFADLQ